MGTGTPIAQRSTERIPDSLLLFRAGKLAGATCSACVMNRSWAEKWDNTVS
jgi:hypothetical protein